MASNHQNIRGLRISFLRFIFIFCCFAWSKSRAYCSRILKIKGWMCLKIFTNVSNDVKRGPEFFWNFSMNVEKLKKYILPHRKEDFAQNCKISNKNYLLFAWRDFKNLFVVCRYDKWTFRQKCHPYSIFSRWLTYE